MVKSIQCKNGVTFSACVADYVDAEWKLQEAYYIAQGCEVKVTEKSEFGVCICDHCDTLEHEFENMIDEIKKS